MCVMKVDFWGCPNDPMIPWWIRLWCWSYGNMTCWSFFLGTSSRPSVCTSQRMMVRWIWISQRWTIANQSQSLDLANLHLWKESCPHPPQKLRSLWQCMYTFWGSFIFSYLSSISLSLGKCSSFLWSNKSINYKTLYCVDILRIRELFVYRYLKVKCLWEPEAQITLKC